MQNGTFVIHHIEKSPDKESLATEHIPLNGKRPGSNDIYTEIEFDNTKLGDFGHATVVHRTPLDCPSGPGIRWLKNGRQIKNVVSERRFDAFHKIKKKLFVSRCARETAHEALCDICEGANPKFSACPWELNLNAAFQDYLKGRILKVFLKTAFPNDKLKNLTENVAVDGVSMVREGGDPLTINVAYGNNVTDNQELLADLAERTISYLRLEWPKNMKAGISRTGSVHFMSSCEEEDCLEFVEFIADKYAIKGKPQCIRK